jgi:lipid A disaccharide synthetase
VRFARSCRDAATAARIAAVKPNVRFEIAAASATLARQIEGAVQVSALRADAVRITVGEASAAMQRAGAGIVASGTATLEAAFFLMPFVLVYRVAWLTYVAARAVVKVKHLGMPNVLAGREIVPEFIQHRARPDSVAAAALTLLEDQAAREEMLANFNKVIAQLGDTGASLKAADAIVRSSSTSEREFHARSEKTVYTRGGSGESSGRLLTYLVAAERHAFSARHRSIHRDQDLRDHEHDGCARRRRGRS